MTTLADHVVADSSYLLDIVSKLNPNASWIADNVDTRLFRGPVQTQADRLRLVWSGVAQKSRHLLAIADVLASLEGAELVLVSNHLPETVDVLREAIPCRFEEFSLETYASTLRSCDVIISPKRLVNGYELGHTEWKITLGMAAGLPAVASPQRSYIEAIEHRGGGFIANSAVEWRDAFAQLRDSRARRALGEQARTTVEERYSTPVIAHRYLELLRSLA
jgi:glycosyltransferase involved in cell wall biosynthesis